MSGKTQQNTCVNRDAAGQQLGKVRKAKAQRTHASVAAGLAVAPDQGEAQLQGGRVGAERSDRWGCKVWATTTSAVVQDICFFPKVTSQRRLSKEAAVSRGSRGLGRHWQPRFATAARRPPRQRRDPCQLKYLYYGTSLPAQ